MHALLTYEKMRSLQTFFWPVFPEERKTTLILSAILFLISGINTLVYPFHYSLLITAPNSGVEIIGLIRLFGCLPFGILLIIAYGWLQNRFSKTEIIIIFYSVFIFVYLLYSFYIIKYNDSLIVEPAVIHHYMVEYPHLKWFFPIYGNWTLSIFYIFTEVFSTISLSQFFWQTANHYTRTDQASRLYPIFIIFLGLGSVFASFFLQEISTYAQILNLGIKNEKIIFILQVVIIIAIALIGILILLYKNFYKHQIPEIQKTQQDEKKQSPSSIFSGFQYLFRYRYLFYIFLTLVFSNIVYQLTSYIWKSELHAYSPMRLSYNESLTSYSLWDGLIVVVFALCTKTLIHKWGWHRVVFITPLLSLILSIPFFALLMIHHINGYFSEILHINPHFLLTMIGSFQTIIMGASIICLYSPTKEMAYVPLEADIKTKGKTATDILGNTVGNAGSGLIQAGLLSWSGGMDLSVIPQLIVLLIASFIAWLYVTRALSKKYLNLINNKKEM